MSGAPYELGGPQMLATNRRIHAEMQEVALIAERPATGS
jgi:hypothetical protein